MRRNEYLKPGGVLETKKVAGIFQFTQNIKRNVFSRSETVIENPESFSDLLIN